MNRSRARRIASAWSDGYGAACREIEEILNRKNRSDHREHRRHDKRRHFHKKQGRAT